MEYQDVLKGRHSVRAFTNEQIAEDKLEELLTLSTLVPSWVNVQNWKIYVATGNKLDEIRKDHMIAYANEVPSEAIWPTPSRTTFPADKQANMQSVYETMAGALENFGEVFAKASASLFNAQAIAYLAIPKTASPWSYYDLGALSMALMLNAKSLGIDSIPAYEFVKYPQKLKEFLGVDPEYDIVMGIGLGYEDKQAPINKVHPPKQPAESLSKIIR